MADKQLAYLYISGRVHALSGTLLPRETLERMAEADSRAAALRVLSEGGMGGASGNGDEALEQQKAALFSAFAGPGAGKAIVALFQIPYDSHNAKALLKAHLAGAGAEDLLSPCGSIPAEQLRCAVREEGSTQLPDWLRAGLAQARQAWTDSRNAQLVDAALDRACFAGMAGAARQSGSAEAEAYVRLCLDGVNLQTVLRMKGAAAEAVEEMLFPGGNSSVARILEGRASSNLAAAFSQPPLCAAAESGRADAAEHALAELLAALAARCRQAPYGAQTLLGFLLGLELRQAAARMILSGKDGGKTVDQEAWEVLCG